jgi:Tol biopolymer transport system component/imidazolonepropionase-like amidohydrolase
MMPRYFIFSLFLFIALNTYSQDDKWDIRNAAEPYTEVTIESDEGTWMNLDVSPDGKHIVFDMVGDIYTMPISGGNAKLLREGHAWETQPRFSPDGKKISFTSDAGGADNIWIMNSDGTNAYQVTKEDFRLMNNAVWTPDGEYIIARKHFTSQRSLGAGELWMYHFSGGTGIQLTTRKNDQQDVGEPCMSPDGKYVYFSEDMYPGGYFQYNKDPNSQIYIIRRYDMESGEVENVIQGPGGAFRSQLSPDGKKIAFLRRVRTKTVLYIHDFETGIQKPVYDKLTKDQQEAWAIFGVYPNYNWMPDNETIVLWTRGKIYKVNTLTGAEENIPFKAKANHKITDALVFEQDPLPDAFQSKVIRNLRTSPDGKRVVFNAAGYLYVQDLPKGKAVRLTRGNDFEFEPSFSPDGESIVYVTWSDTARGAIYSIPSRGGAATKLTSEKGIYRAPVFSPDGTKIAYFKESGNGAQGMAYGVNPGVYWMPANGGESTWVSEDGENPAFNHDGTRIYFLSGGALFGALDKNYSSVDLLGNDLKVHFHSKYAGQYAVSPDGKWLAFGELYQVYIMPFAHNGQTFELSAGETNLPIVKVSDDAGINLQWSTDSKKAMWTLGNKYYEVDLKNAFSFLSGSQEKIEEIEKKTSDINLQLSSEKPKGMIALKGAKIITMKGEEVFEKGTVIINENRITAVGNESDIEIPENCTVIDVSGKTICPGFIDTHAHLNAFRYGLSPQQDWPYFANLAYGITATHDPSSNSEMSLSQSEMVKTGRMVGPRIFTTGTILYGADGDFKAVVNNYDEALSAIARTKAFGAFSVKSYNQPRRNQRQQIIKAGRELEIMVYPEGGSTFYNNMTMILDGHTSIEHNIPIAPLYNDIVQLWAASNTANTPTLLVAYGALNAEYYWYQTTNVWENDRLLSYTPRSIIDSRSRHRTMAPMEEYENGHILISQSCKKLVDAGVKVCVGGHGQLQGLGVHWEMWSLSQGGMTNYEVLRAATINGAEYIGMEKNLGSIEVGKLADLVILDADPLEDIYNTNTVVYTVANGHIYEAETMNEVGNYSIERLPFYWEQEGFNDNFDWHSESQGFSKTSCSCRH